MRRWLLPDGATTADGLTLEETELGSPGPGRVQIAVSAISINARDRMILAGPFGRTPGQTLVPLSDVVGHVDAVGEGVEGWSVGDRVMTAHVPSWEDGPAPEFGPGPGSFDDPGVAAERLVVDAGRLIRVPEHLGRR